MKKTLVYLLFAGLCLGSLAACGDSPASPSAVPSETVESTPTDTPTLTPTATPTAAPTDTPVPTEAEDKFEPVVVRVQESDVTVKTGPGEEYADLYTVYPGDFLTLREEKEVNGIIWYNISDLYDEWIKADEENIKGDAWVDAIVAFQGTETYINCGLETKLIAYDDSNLIYYCQGGGGQWFFVQSKTDPTCFNSDTYNIGYLYVCYLGVAGPYHIQENENELSKTMTIPYSELEGEYSSDHGTCVITINNNANDNEETIGNIEFACDRYNGSGELYYAQGNGYGALVGGWRDDGARYLIFFKDDNGNLGFKFDLFGVQGVFYKK